MKISPRNIAIFATGKLTNKVDLSKLEDSNSLLAHFQDDYKSPIFQIKARSTDNLTFLAHHGKGLLYFRELACRLSSSKRLLTSHKWTLHLKTHLHLLKISSFNSCFCIRAEQRANNLCQAIKLNLTTGNVLL